MGTSPIALFDHGSARRSTACLSRSARTTSPLYRFSRRVNYQFAFFFYIKTSAIETMIVNLFSRDTSPRPHASYSPKMICICILTYGSNGPNAELRFIRKTAQVDSSPRLQPQPSWHATPFLASLGPLSFFFTVSSFVSAFSKLSHLTKYS